MPEAADTRVAVYIDFDNIILSRYDQVHGRNQYQRDRSRGEDDPAFLEKLEQATVDVGAIIDYASSYGTLVLTRAYADWSAAVNARYRGQLVGRAVDLVQLFPAAAYAKNGADIRLAVDAVEDMFRLPDLTHVVIVAGDSDYIALAQRCKRLGRYVIGVGVAGSTSRSLGAACDELVTYDALPGVVEDIEEVRRTVEASRKQATSRRRGKAEAEVEAEQEQAPDAEAEEPRPDADAATAVEGAAQPTRRSRRARTGVTRLGDEDAEPEDPQQVATGLLVRALRLGHEKDDAEWLHNSEVKTQMRRMDPSFSEKALGFRSFSDFLRSRSDVAQLDETSTIRLVRLLPV